MTEKTILIVEDDYLIRRALEVGLRKTLRGVQILSAQDGDEGVVKIEKLQPEIILLDLLLPGKSGFDILGGIQDDIQGGKTVVFVLSNLSNRDDIDRALRLGAKSYFIKSDIDISELADMLQKHLNK